MSILIRAAAVEDAKEIAQVRVTTWRSAYQGLLPEKVLAELDVEDETEKYREGIANLPPERGFFVAETGVPGRVVGYCICGPDRDPDIQDTGEIYALYVLPEFQGRGIGRALVRSAAEWLAARGFRRMIIFVLRENVPSRRFYEAIGGKLEREKIIEIPGRGFTAPEVGYGYDLLEDIKG
jgi:ribosomal protein S18 acetylase RimI-like enzyme